MKHQRLVGADVYVARIAQTNLHEKKYKGSRAAKRKEAQLEQVSNDEKAGNVQPGLSTSPGSLHDELTCKPKETLLSKPAMKTLEDHPSVAESRPCYRCVAYMHSVGIKRVFWTTNDNKWEGAKIRDLIDDLHGAIDREDSSLGLPVPDVFVTKSEVLLLRRSMMAGHKC